MRLFQIAFILFACSVSYGQELVTVSPAETVRTTATTTTNRIIVGSTEISKVATIGPDSAPVTFPIQLVTIDTKASNVRVTIEDANRENASAAFIKLSDKQYASGKAGTYWFRVLAVDFAKNIFDESTVKVVVGSSPGPTPGPTPNPDNPAPIPVAGLRVLFVVESNTAPTLSAGHRSILYSETVRLFLSTSCAKDTLGNPEWRVLDPDTIFPATCDAVWCKALSRPRTMLPWLVVSNGTTGYEGPIPDSVEEFLTLVKGFQ